jgi:hypothetical protein
MSCSQLASWLQSTFSVHQVSFRQLEGLVCGTTPCCNNDSIRMNDMWNRARSAICSADSR